MDGNRSFQNTTLSSKPLKAHIVKVYRNNSPDYGTLTILYEDFHALSEGQSCVQDNEPETEGEDIVDLCGV